MAELTLQIPDELAKRLEPLRDQLPTLLAQLVAPTTMSTTSAIPTVYTEVLDFLLQRPMPVDIVAFKVSPPVQERLQTLLTKNREATLTAEESAELDTYEQLEHLMILLKARAINNLN